MKGIILAGGKGTRLYPLTKITNKHLLPVGPFPMIYYPVLKLRQAGINDILIVTGKEDVGQFAQLLGNGSDFALNFTYRVQDKPGGIAEALFLGKNFVGNSPCTVILGDNLLEDDLTPFVQEFIKGNKKAKVLLKEVENPFGFGIAELKEQRIVAIEEKPLVPKSRYAVTGIYMYRPEVFEVIARLVPSTRGELEISDVNNYFIRTGELSHDILQGFWEDAGTLTAYYNVNELLQTANLFSNSLTRSL
ncbi:sugar phosphate nucleotidyltransferase [Effusibacillus lacus]|uniref:Glucose-1-phosphate thymidylyltransferase n=1 Tax=Effusibacillus lacus TaxID=1348429 RepID=A0A292YT80_9BACL|nr:sugar phosphate nucleotidyltransferase [Effusibacillus lacus]TCS73532.1 glucose-1-phosphate thymidylyltransferase [Effusibacillus lacus]GAX91973.1 spore coat protein [Effusibacillus lacus]